MIDPITESDLSAYVDGELSAMRRVEVEAHLAHQPLDAARVMADLRDRDALREAFSGRSDPASPTLHLSARRVDQALAWQSVGQRLRRAAVIVLLVGAGWLAHNDSGSLGVPDTVAAPVDPTLVEEAEQAREAARIRARSHSLHQIPAYDRVDLERTTGLDLPDLPTEWSVRDVQVFPARNGAGVEVTISADDSGELSFFAMRSSENASTMQAVTRSDDGRTAYWQNGHTSYALTGNRENVDQRFAALRTAARH